MWSLLLEVTNACRFLLGLKENDKIASLYSDRKRPMFSRLFTIITIIETKISQKLEDKLKSRCEEANISVLLFDGLELYLDSNYKEDLELELQSFSKEFGITVRIKDR